MPVRHFRSLLCVGCTWAVCPGRAVRVRRTGWVDVHARWLARRRRKDVHGTGLHGVRGLWVIRWGRLPALQDDDAHGLTGWGWLAWPAHAGRQGTERPGALDRRNVGGLFRVAQPFAFGVGERLVALPLLHPFGHGAPAAVLIIEPGDAPFFGRHVGPFDDAALRTVALVGRQLLHAVGKGNPRALLGRGPGVPFGGERRQHLPLCLAQLFPVGLEQHGDDLGQLEALAGGHQHDVPGGLARRRGHGRIQGEQQVRVGPAGVVWPQGDIRGGTTTRHYTRAGVGAGAVNDAVRRHRRRGGGRGRRAACTGGTRARPGLRRQTGGEGGIAEGQTGGQRQGRGGVDQEAHGLSGTGRRSASCRPAGGRQSHCRYRPRVARRR